MVRLELIKEIAAALDGPCDKLRKVHEKEREIDKAVLRFFPSGMHVDEVAHALERMERDPDGQHHIRQHNG